MAQINRQFSYLYFECCFYVHFSLSLFIWSQRLLIRRIFHWIHNIGNANNSGISGGELRSFHSVRKNHKWDSHQICILKLIHKHRNIRIDTLLSSSAKLHRLHVNTLFPTFIHFNFITVAVLFFYGIKKNHKISFADTCEERSTQIGIIAVDNSCSLVFFHFRFSNSSKSNWTVELYNSSHKYRWKMESIFTLGFSSHPNRITH